MTFNIISPLYYSDGTNHGGGVAVPASLGTYMYFSDEAAPTNDPIYAGLHATVSGSSTTPAAGWQLLSPYSTTGTLPADATYPSGFGFDYGDFGHEMVKQLFIASGSSQTTGDYGFAYTMTAHFSGGLTVTTGPLVDIFALASSDSTASFLGAFGPGSLQDAATIAIYNAVTAQQAVPEPSASAMALLAMSIAASTRRRWCRARAVRTDCPGPAGRR